MTQETVRTIFGKEECDFDDGHLSKASILFRQELNKSVVLEPEEERVLITRIINGRSFKTKLDIKDTPLNRVIYTEDAWEAINVLIHANLKLVADIANKYSGRGVSFMDRVQEGSLGILEAIAHYDEKKNPKGKFSTYATWWIRQKIARYTSQNSRTIRIPGNAVENLSHIKKFQDKCRMEQGKEPEYSEIAEYLNSNKKKGPKWNEKKVQKLINLSMDVAELDKPVRGERGSGSTDNLSTLGDFVGEIDKGMEETSESNVDYEKLRTLMQTVLTEKEIEIIGLRAYNTLEETGRLYGVSRESIRQIIKKVREKLQPEFKPPTKYKEIVMKNSSVGVWGMNISARDYKRILNSDLPEIVKKVAALRFNTDGEPIKMHKLIAKTLNIPLGMVGYHLGKAVSFVQN